MKKPLTPEDYWSRAEPFDDGYETECMYISDKAPAPHGYMESRSLGLRHPAGRYLHRSIYWDMIGPIPDGMDLDHLCRNTACVNPWHLEPVTHRENLMRGMSPSAVHSKKTHCPRGHEYSQKNTYKTPRGERICRECRRQKDKMRPSGWARQRMMVKNEA